MNKKYFVNCKTLEELKKEYKKLAMQYHPDRGGDLRTMQEINAEYDIMFNILKDKHNATSKEADRTTEMSSDFINIINELIHCDGLEIEICGSWLWIGGLTFPYKDIIKKLGFWWAKNKEKWYLKPEGYKSKRHKAWDMEKIRETFGSEKIETKKRLALA